MRGRCSHDAAIAMDRRIGFTGNTSLPLFETSDPALYLGLPPLNQRTALRPFVLTGPRVDLDQVPLCSIWMGNRPFGTRAAVSTLLRGA